MKQTNKKSIDVLYETLGWLGAGGVLLGYALLSLAIIPGNSILYHSLMLFGSAGLALITYKRRAYQPMVVNLVFCFFAIVALIRLITLA